MKTPQSCSTGPRAIASPATQLVKVEIVGEKLEIRKADDCREIPVAASSPKRIVAGGNSDSISLVVDRETAEAIFECEIYGWSEAEISGQVIRREV